MSWATHFRFWALLWIVALLGIPLVTQSDAQIERIRKEYAMTESAFGEQKAQDIVDTTDAEYRVLFDNGSKAAESHVGLKNQRIPDSANQPMGQIGNVIGKVVNNYLYNLSYTVYGMLFRAHVILHWLLYVLPFLLASFVDGFIMRKIKFREFGYISPLAYSFSSHFIVLATFLPIMYLIIPIPISPYFIPGWALLMALPIIMLISNTQRLFQ